MSTLKAHGAIFCIKISVTKINFQTSVQTYSHNFTQEHDMKMKLSPKYDQQIFLVLGDVCARCISKVSILVGHRYFRWLICSWYDASPLIDTATLLPLRRPLGSSYTPDHTVPVHYQHS